MGNSCVIGASSDEATFKWSIDNFSSLLKMGEGCTYSRVFRILGHDWFLKLNPVDRAWYSEDEECVSLGLELCPHSMEPDTIVNAYFIFMMSMCDQYGKHSEHRVRVRHIFDNAHTSCKALKDSTGSFCDNINCVFGVKFIEVFTTKAKTTSGVLSRAAKFNNKAATTRAKTRSEMLFVKNTSTLPEAEAYTWCIADLFRMESPGYSPEFTVGWYKWSIRLDKEENHISLYLKKMTDDLPQGYAVLVELTLSVENQEGGKHLKKTERFQFSNNVRIWGWENLVSMKNMQDPSNGYLIKTKCCIKAEVKIVGFSWV